MRVKPLDLTYLLPPVESLVVCDPLELTEQERLELLAYNTRKAAEGRQHAGRIDKDEVIRRTGRAMFRKLPTTLHCINEAREWAVIGGGPSINDHVETIRRLKRRGVNIVSVNKSHDWLLEHGIVPWAHVLLDPKEWVADYVKRPRMDVRYLVASQCHDMTFHALTGYPVFLWHAGQDFENVAEPHQHLSDNYPDVPWHVIPGATTVGLRTPILGHMMPNGPDKFHMIGFDSSRTESKLHAYAKPEAQDAVNGKQWVTYRGTGYCFDTNSHMKRQLDDFVDLIAKFKTEVEKGRLRPSFNTKFYGHGLLPFYAATLGLHADPECNKDPAKVGGYIGTQGEPETPPASVVPQFPNDGLSMDDKLNMLCAKADAAAAADLLRWRQSAVS